MANFNIDIDQFIRSPEKETVTEERFSDPVIQDWIRKPKESKLSAGARHALRTGSRVAEGFLGGPGEIANLAADIARGVGRYAAPEMAEKFGTETGELEGIAGKVAPQASRKGPLLFEGEGAEEDARLFPGVKELRQISDTLLKERGQPSGKTSEAIDQWAERTGLLLSPPGALKLGKAALVAAGAQTTKEAMKALGVGEGKQALGEIGTMLALSMWNPGGAKDYVSSLYRARDAALPENALVSSVPLRRQLDSLEKTIAKGGGAKGTAGKKEIQRWIDLAREKMQGDLMPVEELIALKQDINSTIRDVGGLAGIRKFLPRLSGAMEDSIELYGKQSNPSFLKLHKKADTGFAGLKGRDQILSEIEKSIAGKNISPETAALLGVLHGKPARGLVVGGGLKALESMQGAKRALTNPTIRKYYSEALTAAARNDTAALSGAIEKLNEAVKDDSRAKTRRPNQ